MVLNKLRENLYIRKSIKLPVEALKCDIKGKEAIAVCPSTTSNSWQGVLTATQGLFSNRVFQIPQYYSTCIYSEKELHDIARLLINLESEHIVFSGYLPYFDVLMQDIVRSGKKVSLIYHGSHTSVLEDPNAAEHFDKIFKMQKQGLLYHIGFVKKDMDKTFEMHTGQKSYPIILKTNESLIGRTYPKYEGLNIGVMTHDAFRKNFYNMLSAALLHQDAKVHVKSSYLGCYMQNKERIVEHGYFKNQEEFYKVIGSVHVNMYVTFSECWGQFVNESLAMGVPCLCSDVSAVLDFDTELKKKLIVPEFDNDYAIYIKSLEVLQDLDYYKTIGPEYVRKVNGIANQYFENFVEI